MIRITHLKVTRVELWRLVHVLQQSPGCANHNVASGHQLALLLNLICRSSDYETSREIVITAHLSQLFECLRWDRKNSVKLHMHYYTIRLTRIIVKTINWLKSSRLMGNSILVHA